ncbi:hypothetical protein BWI96_08525 [Siphonobacter sp. SORGH_AS_0500]|nr:hypothetical protein BWI96_08525 [Siphonobacter sp. SORGH_AS_0500]
MKPQQIYLIIIIFYCSFSRIFVFAQQNNIRIELGASSVPLGKPYTISVVITGSEDREYDRFPDIIGMSRRGTTTTTSTTTVGNRSEIVQRITQNYIPNQPGNYVVTPFTMNVNGQSVQSMGGIVIVTDAIVKEAELEEEEEVVEPMLPDAKASAFLLLSANRNQVYTGEGFNLSLGFFVADDNPLEMDFYALNLQLGAILKQIRPANCWEENFGIRGEPQIFETTIKGRKYTEYRLFQAVYFPLNTERIQFPSVSLKMIVKNEKAGKQEFLTFSSKPIFIQPIALPKDPQQNQAVTGDYTVRDELSTQVVQTGKSVQYKIIISGTGNLTPILIPTPENDNFFDFYPPSIQQSVVRRRGRVSGEKTFTFQIIPKQAGNFPLSTYFRWIFFNPRTKAYQRWKSDLVLKTQGERVTNTDTDGLAGTIFSNLENVDSTKPFVNVQATIMSLANGLLAIMVLGMAYIFVRSRRG